MMRGKYLIIAFAMMVSAVAGLQAKKEQIKITWSNGGVKVDCPQLDSLKVNVEGGHVRINNKYQSHSLTFLLTGNGQAGSLLYKGKHKCRFVLDNLTLRSTDSIPLNIKNSKTSTLLLKGNNVISVETDTLDAAMICTKGDLVIEGEGSLSITSASVGCKGIKVGKDMTMDGGKISIATSGMYVQVDTTSHFGPPPGGGPMGMFAGPADAEDKQGFPGRPAFPGPPDKGDFPNPPSGQGFHGFPGGEGFPFPADGEGFPGPMGNAGPPGKQKYDGTTKGIRVKGNITINAGELHVSTTTPGAEGLEGKGSVVINGGDVHIDAYDDGINSGGKIVFAGGKVRVLSHDNDAVDSNAQTGEAIVISGGDTEAVSLKGSPEEGFDCDFSPIIVTGGRAIGMGGAMGPEPSIPTEETASQPTLIISSRQLTKGDTVRILTSKGKAILSFTASENFRDAHLLLTCPQLEMQKTYQVEFSGEAPQKMTVESKLIRF